jgi:general secretion pathway protein K
MSKQSGVALITALLIIALVTAAAVAMASRQQLDIRRTGNALQRDQAYAYAVGAEVMARAVLEQDDAKVDDKEEDWARSKVTIPFQGGLLTGQVEDLQARFNVNNLVKDGQRSPWDVERFKRLLQVIKEKSENREAWAEAEPADLANAATDWIDADNDPLPGGAEDTDYLQRERPYRAGNAPMASISELLLVRGFTLPIYNEVAPFVTALPERSKINVNTAKVELVRALGEDVSCIDVNKLNRAEEAPPLTPAPAEATTAAAEKKTVYNKVDDFWQSDAIAGCNLVGIKNKKKDNKPPPTTPPEGDDERAEGGAPPNQPAAGTNAADTGKLEPEDVLSVNSGYFQVNAYAEVGPDDHRVRVKMYSVLRRADGKIATLSRMQGFE